MSATDQVKEWNIDEREILKHYIGNPKCPSCHGTKRLGVNLTTGALMLCHCARPHETEYAIIGKQLSGIAKAINSMILANNFIIEKQNEIDSRTFWERVKRIFS